MLNKTQLVDDLKTIWEALTPEELRQIDVFRDSMEIFIETIEELSKPSIDISKTLQEPYFHEEFFKTYNAILYDTLRSLDTNTKFYDGNQLFNVMSNGHDVINLDILRNTSEYVQQPEFLTFRKFFESKGLKSGFHFQYDWIGKHSQEKIEKLKIEEVDRFRLELEGTMSRVVYDYFVRVVQNPLGFQYQYTQLLKIDLDYQNEMEYYFNNNNEYKITPDVIDCEGPDCYDQFYQNTQNEYLKPRMYSTDFDGFTHFYERFRYDFSKLDFFFQDKVTYNYGRVNFLYDLDSNREPILIDGEPVKLEVLEFDIKVFLTGEKRTWEFNNGKKIIFDEIYLYDQKLLTYFDSDGSVLFTMGDGENDIVELKEEDIEYEVLDGRTSVLDYPWWTEYWWLDDEKVERHQGDHTYWDGTNDIEWGQEVPEEWRTDNPHGTVRENINIGFDHVYYIEYQHLEQVHKPLVFDFKPRGEYVQKETPFNNDIFDSNTLQNATYDPSYNSWDSQYFDMDKPLRTLDNHDKVFQQHSDDQKFFFSPLHYEPWQLFEVINDQHYEELYSKSKKWLSRWKEIDQDIDPMTGETSFLVGVCLYVCPDEDDIQEEHLINNFGIWTREETRWKFIGQDPEELDGVTGIKIGQENLTIGRGVREYCDIPNFMKEPQLLSNPNYEKSKHNLEDRPYWQSQVNQSYLIIGNVPEPIGHMTGSSYTNFVGLNAGGEQDDRLQYNEFMKWKRSENHVDFMLKDEIDEPLAHIKWFEMPKPRVTQTPEGDLHTFYRPISPRQEEYNYMHFNVRRGDDVDPVNLQYRTLEQFDIKLITY